MVAMEQHRRPRRSFPNEYKVEVVELCRTSGRSIAAVARDLDLSETAVRRWVSQAAVDAGPRDRLTTAAREELARLRQDGRVPRDGRDIPQRDTALLATGTHGARTPSTGRRRSQSATSARPAPCSRSPAPPSAGGSGTFPRPGPSPTPPSATRSSRSTNRRATPTGRRASPPPCVVGGSGSAASGWRV